MATDRREAARASSQTMAGEVMSNNADLPAAQCVQRCRIQSGARFGAVHRLGQSVNHTDCGVEIAGGGWWVLGNETEHAVTCRACLRVDRMW